MSQESTPSDDPSPKTNSSVKKTAIVRFLDGVEWLGNKLPDPALLFLGGMLTVWVFSLLLSGVEFTETLPNRSDPIQIVNLLSLERLAIFLSTMVEVFVGFHPLGVVLVALLGVGVAEKSGFINAILKSMLNVTPRSLLTPMLILVAIISHTAADAGYVLVIPIGGAMFYAAGRHPLAGIAAAFAGVSGGFSACFVPTGIDPLLSNLTQTGVDLIDPSHTVNPLCNIFFTATSSILIVLIGWFLTDWVIEPRLKNTPVDGDPKDVPKIEELTSADRRGMKYGLLSILMGAVLLVVWAFPEKSALRDSFGKLDSYRNKQVNHGIVFEEGDLPMVQSVTGPGKTATIETGDVLTKINGKPVSKADQARDVLLSLAADKAVVIELQRNGATVYVPLAAKSIPGAPMMHAIVPIIFFFFLIPGLVHGYISGNFENHRDVVHGMSKTMETMGYYLVLVFFAALFIQAFSVSNIGTLLAIKGANAIKSAGLSPQFTIFLIILLSASVNLLVGSASAKWAMLAPIFVPMLMAVGISPELTQAAYRIGDSTTNIITPMMPYFPLVVVFCQRYVKSTGIGTVAAMMLPFSLTFLVTWTIFLIAYWQLGFPLGIDAGYAYVKAS
ncbi:AbgT family transporter [Pirellulaceae bacterium]|jgi:p-aminobenzoyl-glutamate transporter AbgT|nr:AbgT family transporter [Pirellulaceae bacterium]